MGQHRPTAATYARRRAVALLIVLAILGLLVFLLVRVFGDDGPEEAEIGAPAEACARFRSRLVQRYEDAREAEVAVIDVLDRIEGGTPVAEVQDALRQSVASAQGTLDAIGALPRPPEPLLADFTGIRASVNEFVRLADRTAQALLSGGEAPTTEPTAQLRNLYDSQTDPTGIAPCD